MTTVNIPQESELERLRREIEHLKAENERYSVVQRIGQELGRQLVLADLLPLVIAKVTEVMQADRSSLFLYDERTEELWTMVSEGLDSTVIRIPVSNGIAGHVATQAEMLNIPDAYECELFDRTWDQKTGYRTRSVLCLPMISHHGGVLGVIQVLNKKGGAPFCAADESLMQQLVSQIAVYVENADLYRRIQSLFENIVEAISIALDSRDPVTAGHSKRVSQYSLAIAKAMHTIDHGPFEGISFSREKLRELRYACMLHDFGKVGVPEAILQKGERLELNWSHVIQERMKRLQSETRLQGVHLEKEADCDETCEEIGEYLDFILKLNRSGFLSEEAAEQLDSCKDQNYIDEKEYYRLSIKRGTLTPEERQLMEEHVSKTLSVLSAIGWPDAMKNIPELAGSHHEAMDGSGYPRGLKGDEIPLGARIMGVADVYDALTAQDRPYKPAIPHEKSAAILRDMAESGKLQPEIVSLFLDQELFNLP
ncbi:MAG: GAF and HD-GYP domain-containing protein [Planctomycetota bacterium]|jgi:HD-GYP domain-containing protein (c-di-GMP phosphodiesterase class II)